MVQIDGPKRHLYLKFQVNERMQDVIQSTRGQVKYRPTSGEISIVPISTAGMGMIRVVIASLPSEVSDEVLRTVLSK